MRHPLLFAMQNQSSSRGMKISPGEHQSLKHIMAIEYWLHVWDNALDKGCAGTVAIQRLIRFLATPAFSDRVCPECQNPIDSSISSAEHLIQCLPVSSVEHFCTATTNFQDSVFVLSKSILVYCICFLVYIIMYL